MPAASNQHILPRRAILDAIVCTYRHTSSSICMSMDEARAEKTSLSAVGLEMRSRTIALVCSLRTLNKVENNRVSVLTQNIEWQTLARL